VSEHEQLKLTARYEGGTVAHDHLGVFQNGDKAGVLVVDAKHSKEAMNLINGAQSTRDSHAELLAACKELLVWAIPTDPDNPQRSINMVKDLRRAVAAIKRAGGDLEIREEGIDEIEEAAISAINATTETT
jgi:hypothetical protein